MCEFTGKLHLIRRLWKFAIGPLLFYSICFALLTFPLILQFNRLFLTDRLDGYQAIWDVWWVRHALLDLHQNPYTTHSLRFPDGSSLLLHSLTPINGLMGIPLGAFLNQIQVFNTLAIFAFAGSGVTAFWLCWNVTKKYWPSLAGGFGFAFCSFRWAHFSQHLALTSTQVMPLFVLGLLTLLKRPRIGTAIATAAALFAVLLSDQYQFFYCSLITGIVAIWAAASRRSFFFGRKHLIAFAVFFVLAGVTCGPIVLATDREAATAAIVNPHHPDWYSGDLLGPWIPDWTWVYNRFTSAIWKPLDGSYVERSVCLGPALLIAAAFGMFRARSYRRFRLGSSALFVTLAAAFVLLCFGPIWRFWTIPVTSITPYRLLATVLPQLRFAGCPGRMIIVAQLALSVLAAAGLSRIGEIQSAAIRTTIAALFVVALVIESQPHVLDVCPPQFPAWVTAVKKIPDGRGLINLTSTGGGSLDMYFQTLHHHPIPTGELSRVSAKADSDLRYVLRAVDEKRYARLADMGFGFIVTDATLPPLDLPKLYSDRATTVFVLPAVVH